MFQRKIAKIVKKSKKFAKDTTNIICTSNRKVKKPSKKYVNRNCLLGFLVFWVMFAVFFIFLMTIFPEIFQEDEDNESFFRKGTDSQCAQRILNKISKPLNGTFTGITCTIQGFKIYFI